MRTKAGLLIISCFFFCFLVIANMTIAETDERYIDLNYLSKIHVTSIKEFNVKKNGYDIIQIPKEAFNLTIKNNINFNITHFYNDTNINDIFNLLGGCYEQEACRERILDGNHSVILVFYPNELSVKSVIFYIDYYIPYNTKKYKVFRNSFIVDTKHDADVKTVILLPPDNKLWVYSSLPKIDEKNNRLHLTWNNIEEDRLSITYGTTDEYLFYDLSKSNVLSNFITILITIFTVFFSFGLYLKASKKEQELELLFIIYMYIVLFIFAIFIIFMPRIINMIPPFFKSYMNSVVIIMIATLLISISAFLLIKFWRQLLKKLEKILN